MSLLRYFKRPQNKSAAAVAKERLQIIVSHEHATDKYNPDFIQKLQTELMEVLSRYVQIDKDNIRVQLERAGDQSILELNVTLTDEVVATT